MPQVDFVRHLAQWYKANRDPAGDAGIVLKFGQTEDERPKPSAWVAAEKQGRIADLTVWSSGEVEFVAGRHGDIQLNEHHELETAQGLDLLLERLLAFVGQ